MKRGWTTLGGIAVHDFRRALRVLEKDVPRHELLKLLADRIRSKLVYVLAAYPFLLFGVFLIADCKVGNVILLPEFLGFAEIPLSYVVFVLAWLCAGVVLGTHSICLMGRYLGLLVWKSFPSGSVAAYTAPYLGLPVFSLARETYFRLAKAARSSRRSRRELGLYQIPISGICAAFLFVDLFIFSILMSTAIAVVRAPETETHGHLLGYVSLCFLLGPLLNVVAYRIPIRYR
ncbi:hypothetical protein [Aestuariivirga sp.]|uniref:hypothetical protein n=1 Tax=Aestuariivirga sp. TaxID=2650926 RepID=UPI0025BCB9A7|nr:hypothetical protein [Aestuariivirga sp.]MCA3555247.1 hypothetical protein [Aestuariivirga sp.]